MNGGFPQGSFIGGILYICYINPVGFPGELSIKSFVLVGGVAANNYIKIKLNNFAEKEGLSFFCPPLNLCTDNAAMVSWAGIEYIINFGINNVDNLDFIPRPLWPLDPKSKPIGRAKHAR